MAWNIFKRKPTDPAKVLGTGWQFYSKPTSLEKPGTIFRIDKDKVKFIVETLQIVVEEGEEAFGKSTETINIDSGVALRIFGLKNMGIDLNAVVSNHYQLTFDLREPVREITTDVEVGKSIANFWGKLDYRADNRYFIIREAKKGAGLTYHLSKDQINQLGGEINIQKGLMLNGNLLKLQKDTDYTLEGDFKNPLRVMFLAEEIKPVKMNLASNQIELGTVPVNEQLDWIE